MCRHVIAIFQRHRTNWFIPVFFGITSALAASASWAQQEFRDFPEFEVEEGPFDEVRSPIGKLFRLELDESGRISLSQRSWQANRVSDEARKQLLLDHHTDMGSIPEHFVATFVDEELSVLSTQPSMASLNDTLLVVMDEMSLHERSRSSSPGMVQMRYVHGDYTLNVHHEDQITDLRLNEKKDARRKIRVFHDPSTTRFTMLVEGKSSFARIRQGSDQFTATLRLEGKEARVVSASYTQFIREYPALHERLEKIYELAGISMPPSIESPEVVKYVKLRLVANSPELEARFEALLPLLESDQYRVRQTAVAHLKEEFFKYQSQIQSRLAADHLLPETRKSLDQVLRHGQSVDRADVRILEIVDSENLFQSPDYLVSLLEGATVDEREAICRHLASTTKQAFGNDVEKWKKWVAEGMPPGI